MGLYDSFNIATRCPYCGTIAERESQTKIFDNPYMRSFREGDWVPADELEVALPCWIKATASCAQAGCQLVAARRDIYQMGYVSGFSLSWKIAVEINVEARVTGQYRDIKVVHAAPLPTDWEQRLPYQEVWASLADVGDEMLRLRRYAKETWDRRRADAAAIQAAP